jgi:hypothetical protein
MANRNMNWVEVLELLHHSTELEIDFFIVLDLGIYFFKLGGKEAWYSTAVLQKYHKHFAAFPSV